MTATQVNGIDVVTQEPVESHMVDGHGGKRPFARIVRLLLSDGTDVYGCTVCDHTQPTDLPVQQMMQHLGKDHPEGRSRPNGTVKGGPPADLRDLTLADVYRLAQLGLNASTQIAKWKRRATDAEKRLEDGRRAFLGTPAGGGS